MVKRIRRKISVKAKILIFAAVVLAIVFLPTTILLTIGMLPTCVAWLVSKSENKSQVLAVGAMNIAGCMPFILDLWKSGQSMASVIHILTPPELWQTIIIIYFAALVGKMIDWATTGIVSSIMFQNAKNRLKEIKKQKEALIDKWGKEVTGTIPLDQYGFPVEEVVDKKSDQKTTEEPKADQ